MNPLLVSVSGGNVLLVSLMSSCFTFSSPLVGISSVVQVLWCGFGGSGGTVVISVVFVLLFGRK